MNHLIVKICGLREVAHARVAVDAGADLVGFVFAPTRRYVAPDVVASIVAALPISVRKVGLFVDESPELVRSIVRGCGLDYAQLCGDETIDYCEMLGVPAIKSFRVRGPEVVDDVAGYAEHVTWSILDGYQANAYGGTGASFDWQIARAVTDQYKIILAGGLSPTNVADAIQIARPMGVDVSSGVETNGVKDIAKIASFVEAVRFAETKLLV